MGLAISTRFGVITVSQGAMYFFVLFCCIPILLPAVYFMRNPKHLISVLQDHNIMSSAGTPHLAIPGVKMYKIVTDFARQYFSPHISAPTCVRARKCVFTLSVCCLVCVSIDFFACNTFNISFIFTNCNKWTITRVTLEASILTNLSTHIYENKSWYEISDINRLNWFNHPFYFFPSATFMSNQNYQV